MTKDGTADEEIYSRDFRETRLPYSEIGMSNTDVADDSVKDLKASLADDVSSGRISAEDADKVIGDQISYHKEALDNRSDSAGQLVDNVIASKKLGQ